MPKPKMSALVASAIRNLRDIRGSTSKDILNYIKAQYNGPDSAIQKQIHTALKRGLDYGILKRDRGYYSLNTDLDAMYKTQNVPPLEQGRRRRKRRRGRRVSRSRGRRGRGRGRRRRGRGARRRTRGRGRRRRSTRRSRRGSRRGSRRRASSRVRSLSARCRCTPRKRTVNTIRKEPLESVRRDNEHSYEKDVERMLSRLCKSRERSQTGSRSTSSDKGTIDDQDHGQS